MPLIEFGIVTTGVQYVIGASKIGKPVRSRLPAGLRDFVSCEACAGFWIGVALTPWGPWPSWTGAALSGLAGLVLTSIGRSLMALAVQE